jgi:hypothetical protein
MDPDSQLLIVQRAYAKQIMTPQHRKPHSKPRSTAGAPSR